jgi:hypothetical protein
MILGGRPEQRRSLVAERLGADVAPAEQQEDEAPPGRAVARRGGIERHDLTTGARDEGNGPARGWRAGTPVRNPTFGLQRERESTDRCS